MEFHQSPPPTTLTTAPTHTTPPPPNFRFIFVKRCVIGLVQTACNHLTTGCQKKLLEKIPGCCNHPPGRGLILQYSSLVWHHDDFSGSVWKTCYFLQNWLTSTQIQRLCIWISFFLRSSHDVIFLCHVQVASSYFRILNNTPLSSQTVRSIYLQRLLRLVIQPVWIVPLN